MQALEARADPADLLVSLKEVHKHYKSVNFDEVACYELLRKAVNGYRALALFALYRDAKSNNELRDILKDFVAGVYLFGKSHHLSGERNEKSLQEDVNVKFHPTEAMMLIKIMAWPYAQGDKPEEGVDRRTNKLTHQFAHIIVMKRQKMKAELHKGTYGHPEEYVSQNCSLCNWLDHSATSCDENPHLNTRSRRCRRLGNVENKCRVCSPHNFQNLLSERNQIVFSHDVWNDQKDSVRFIAEGLTEIVVVTKQNIAEKRVINEARLSAASLLYLFNHVPVCPSKSSKWSILTAMKKKTLQETS